MKNDMVFGNCYFLMIKMDWSLNVWIGYVKLFVFILKGLFVLKSVLIFFID